MYHSAVTMNAITGLIIACLALTAYGSPDLQITGGSDAMDGAYPYQVSLKTDPKVPHSHFCSGAIINEHYILTSARCIIQFLKNPYNVHVIAGSNYLDSSNVTIHRVMNLIAHAGFNNLLRTDDIALIEISGTITFNDNVQPIDLPTADRNFDGYPLLASGWGRLWRNGPKPNRLQEILMRGYSHQTCSRRVKNIRETQICTSTIEKGKGACYGDGGGPLVADGILVGILSFSNGPCGINDPDVSTRVFSYRSWIKYYTGI